MKIRIFTSHNTRGTNQYKEKRKSDWKKILFFYLAIVGALIIGASIQKAYVKEKDQVIATLNMKVYAQGKELVKIEDPRIKKVREFLKSYNSPLAEHAKLIVSEADRNDIPWTLIVAIAGKESTFGKHIKPGSHNAWGVMTWNKAGDRSIRVFQSWEDGIIYESALLGKNYRVRMNKGIQESYCPSFECSDTWTVDVTGFQESINTK